MVPIASVRAMSDAQASVLGAVAAVSSSLSLCEELTTVKPVK